MAPASGTALPVAPSLAVPCAPVVTRAAPTRAGAGPDSMSVAGLAEAAQAVSTSAVADAASLVAWQLLVTWTETPSVARRCERGDRC